MSNQLKFIVGEVNKRLSKEYNLISFDALSPEQLLQVVIDVLASLDAITKFDVLDTDPETTSMRMLDSLRGLKYRPPTAQGGTAGLRKGVVRGDRRVLHPVLAWLLQNPEDMQKRAYLAKYLMKVEIPIEALSTAELSALWEQYEALLEAFKEAHRSHEDARVQGAQTRELRADMEAMEKELDTVQTRIERLDTRLDSVPNRELLLTSARSLRTERDRGRELVNQLHEQRAALQRATQGADRLRRHLQEVRQANKGTTPHDVMRRINEETKVNEFMVREKLPQELQARKAETEILQAVLSEPMISREYIMGLQSKLDAVVREVQVLVEEQLQASGGPGDDRLGPFRQQAALVARAKDAAGERVHELTSELRAVEAALAERMAEVQELLGDTILRGEDLKKYVNKLRAKSSVYKKKRAQLSCIKAEAGVVTRTIEILCSRDPTLPDALKEREFAPEDKLESSAAQLQGADLAREVAHLAQTLAGAKARMAPLTKELRPAREKISVITEEYEIKKKIFDSASTKLNTESADLESEVTSLRQEVQRDEEAWQKIQMDSEQAEDLLDRAHEEANGGTSHVDELKERIQEKEKMERRLKEELVSLTSIQGHATEQRDLWTRLSSVLEVKTRCFSEALGRGTEGTLRVTHNAETLTFNN